MKTPRTLVEDIHNMVRGITPPVADKHNIEISYAKWHNPRSKEREAKVLYFSEVGKPCPRQLWFNYNGSAEQEQHEAPTLIKFFYGDMLEELVLNMAEDAGHTVEGRQQAYTYDVGNGWIVRGRIDAIIDGAVVDVKSVTKYSEEKFKGGLVDDPFGYKGQLLGYAAAGNFKEAGFLTIQKELGHIGYYPVDVDHSWFSHQAQASVEVVSEKDYTVLPRYDAVPQSATSKNMKLPTACSYCSYKKECWKDSNDGKGVRTFLYSTGPVHLVHVADVPRVMEVV